MSEPTLRFHNGQRVKCKFFNATVQGIIRGLSRQNIPVLEKEWIVELSPQDAQKIRVDNADFCVFTLFDGMIEPLIDQRQ